MRKWVDNEIFKKPPLKNKKASLMSVVSAGESSYNFDGFALSESHSSNDNPVLVWKAA